jgi:hypothetical protein
MLTLRSFVTFARKGAPREGRDAKTPRRGRPLFEAIAAELCAGDTGRATCVRAMPCARGPHALPF